MSSLHVPQIKLYHIFKNRTKNCCMTRIIHDYGLRLQLRTLMDRPMYKNVRTMFKISMEDAATCVEDFCSLWPQLECMFGNGRANFAFYNITADFNGLQSKCLIIKFEARTAVLRNNSIFSDITQCSPLIVDRCFGGTREWLAFCLLQAGFLLGLFFNLKFEKIYSSEMSAGFQRTIRHYIP